MIVLYIVLGLFVLYTIVTFIIALCFLKPKQFTMEQTIETEKSKNYYRDYDDFKKEDVEIKSFDNYILHGTIIYNDEESNKWVICSHGYNYTRIGSIKYVHVFKQLGYNCLIYDARSFGDNKKTYCTAGNKERYDIGSIIKYLKDRFKDVEIGLHGESMGAAESMLALPLNQDLKFAVLDCGYSNLAAVLGNIPKAALFTIKYGLLLFGININKISPLEAIKNNKDVPVLFIHGDCDSQVNCKNSLILYENAISRKDIMIVKGAEHSQSFLTAEKDYIEKVKTFIG